MKPILISWFLVACTPAWAQAPTNPVATTPDGAPNGSSQNSMGAGGEVATPSTPSPPGGPVSLASIQARFARLDTNRNGYLSAEELNLISRNDTISSSAARFNQMDTNHDGRISMAEYTAVQTALEAGAIQSNPSSTTVPTASASGASSGTSNRVQP